jgi:polyisoprenoid-binding protein YceI
MSIMARRIAVGAGAAALIALIVAGLIVRQIVFGGSPSIHRLAGGTPSAAKPCPTIGPASTVLTFSIDTQRSSAQYQAQFLVQGQAVPGTVTGVTGDVSGTFALTQQPDPTIQSLTIVVNLANLNSGAAERDSHVANDTLEITRFPQATFTASDVRIVAGKYVAGLPVAFDLPGNLTLHGVTHPATFAMRGTLDGNSITGVGMATIHLPDYQMKPPQTTSVLTITVDEHITLLVHFSAHRTGCTN